MTDAHEGSAAEPAPRSFPTRIHFTPHAEQYLVDLSEALVLGTVGYESLPPSLRALWTFAFEEGRRHSPTQQLRDEADRLWTELSRRKPIEQGQYITQAELKRLRSAPGREPTEPAFVYYPPERP